MRGIECALFPGFYDVHFTLHNERTHNHERGDSTLLKGEIDFADTGHHFNPLTEQVQGAYDDDEEDCEEGGLGIFLVRRNFDKLKYTYENFRGEKANILSLWLKMT